MPTTTTIFFVELGIIHLSIHRRPFVTTCTVRSADPRSSNGKFADFFVLFYFCFLIFILSWLYFWHILIFRHLHSHPSCSSSLCSQTCLLTFTKLVLIHSLYPLNPSFGTRTISSLFHSELPNQPIFSLYLLIRILLFGSSSSLPHFYFFKHLPNTTSLVFSCSLCSIVFD